MLLAGDPWNKTVDTLTKKLKNRGLDGKHIDLVEDVVSNNYERVLGLSEDGQENEFSNQYCESNHHYIYISLYLKYLTLIMNE